MSKANVTSIEKPSKINYIDLGIKRFIKLLNNSDSNFMQYNKNCLYVLRNGDYKDIKKLLTKIEGNEVSIVRGGSQKSHITSPLELRLSCYLMALSNFNYKYITYLNLFNSLSKDRYLPYFKE